MTAVTLELPWSKPPLSMNGREHWAAKAKLVKQIRLVASGAAAFGDVPRGLEHVTVSLHYRPRDKRRRDADNLVPVLKACCDGLVDWGLVADDTPELMTKLMPVIHPAVKGEPGRMWLELDWEEACSTSCAS